MAEANVSDADDGRGIMGRSMRSDGDLFFGCHRRCLAALLAAIFVCLSCENAVAKGLGCDKSERALINDTIESRTKIKELRVIVANNWRPLGERIWESQKDSFAAINGMQAAVQSQNAEKLRVNLKLFFVNEQTGGVMGRDLVLKGATAVAPATEGAIGSAIGRLMTNGRFDTLLACKLVGGNMQLPYLTACNTKIRQFMEDSGGGDGKSSVCSVFWEVINNPRKTTP